MVLNIVDRLNIIRKEVGLSKIAFEKSINKSNGYLNSLEKNGRHPSTEVVIDVINIYSEYNLNWIMTGEEPMKKSEHKHEVSEEPETDYEAQGGSLILAMRDDLKNDLKELSQGMVNNFEVLGRGMKRSIIDQQKILKFIETLNAEEISKATKDLHLFLDQNK